MHDSLWYHMLEFADDTVLLCDGDWDYHCAIKSDVRIFSWSLV